jgi:hypothetical protein
MVDTLVVLAIVAVAAWYVVRRFVSMGKGGGGCGCGCSCPGSGSGCGCAGKDGNPTACPENGKQA